MCLDDLFYNGKTKAGTTFIFASGKIRLVKAVPDLLMLSLGIPMPVSFTETKIFSYLLDAWM